MEQHCHSTMQASAPTLCQSVGLEPLINTTDQVKVKDRHTKNDVLVFGNDDAFEDSSKSQYRNVGDEFAAIVKLANHVKSMDAESIMQAVESKLLEAFSSWDLIVRRSKIYQESIDGMDEMPNLIQLLLSEVEGLINQICQFFSSYMEPVIQSDAAGQSDEDAAVRYDDIVVVSEVISAAMGLVRGTWKVSKPISSFPERFKQLFNNISSKFVTSVAGGGKRIGQARKRGKRKKVSKKRNVASCCPQQEVQKREESTNGDEETNAVDKPFKCDHQNCSYTTTSKVLLQKHHLKRQHSDGMHYRVDQKLLAKCETPASFASGNNSYDFRLDDQQPPELNPEDIVVKKEQYNADAKLPYSCDKCTNVYAHFATEHALKVHMKHCTGSSKNKEHCLWTCDGGCGKEFFYLRSLYDHRPKCKGIKIVSAQWKRSPVSGEFMCGFSGCNSNETWIGMYGLRQHFFAEHVTEEDKVFKCDHCEARFAYRTMKNEHTRKFHLRQYICSYCGRAFAERHKLRDHQFMHTGEKPFACHHCDYRAAKKYNLDAHKLSKHGDTSGRSFFCETCGKSFLTKSNLRGHITVVHEGGRAINLTNGTTRKKP